MWQLYEYKFEGDALFRINLNKNSVEREFIEKNFDVYFSTNNSICFSANSQLLRKIKLKFLQNEGNYSQFEASEIRIFEKIIKNSINVDAEYILTSILSYEIDKEIIKNLIESSKNY